MPEIAYKAGARLVIINRGETPLDRICHLRFWESTGEILPLAVAQVKESLKAQSNQPRI